MIISAALIIMVPCGRVMAAKKIALDIENNPVYRNVDAGRLISALGRDPEAADSYKGKHFAVLGRYGGSGDDFSLTSLSSGDKGELACKKTDSTRMEYTPSAGDTVWVYGKFGDSRLFGNNTAFTVDLVRKASAGKASESTFSLLDGASMDKGSMKRRTLDEVGFSYYIPSHFEAVEEKLEGEVPVYQYKLNHLDGSGAPESLFVFCVDEYCLKDRGDINKDADVQKAIIRNIVGGSTIHNKSLPFLYRDYDRTVIKGDHTTFANYSGTYKAGRYYLEFVFPESGDRPYQTCFLYVYNNEKHADDILLMLTISMLGDRMGDVVR